MKVIQLFKNEGPLVKRAAKRDREAQRKLYERYAPKMLSVCRQYVRDLHHAEEVMLNGFYKVFTHLKDYRHEGSFEGWMRRIMVRESISFLRTRKRIHFLNDDLQQIETQIDPVGAAMDAAHIQELIDSLPEGYKMVFVMYAIDGYKHSEIAHLLGISVGTSKSQLFKARKLLQEKLELEKEREHGTGKI